MSNISPGDQRMYLVGGTHTLKKTSEIGIMLHDVRILTVCCDVEQTLIS